MGTGSSKKRPDIEDGRLQKKADAVANTMAAVGALKTSKNAHKTQDEQTTAEQSRASVHEMLRESKREKESNWNELQEQYKKEEEEDGENDNTAVLESKSTHAKTFTFQAPDSSLSSDNICPLCGKVTMYGLDGYPCRVCGQAYHKPCLQSTRRYSPSELAMVDRAKTKNLGWSCEKCDNLCNLLSDAEMDEIAGRFEQFDINKDSSVSLDEYLSYRAGVYKEDMNTEIPKSEIEFQKIQFQYLDADGSGTVDYWEFLKDDAVRILSRKTDDELVQFLTPLEIASVQKVFDHLDKDKDGNVTEHEARLAFRSWYNFLKYVTEAKGKNVASSKGSEHGGMLKPERDSDDTHHHVSVHVGLVMDADKDGDTFVTWNEFLKAKAIYIISSRPNKTQCQLEKF